jgi:hypothetical protein
MLRKGLIACLVAAALSVSAFAADIFVKIAPPRPVVETRVAAPGPGYVWTPGYHRWDGHAYVWTPGAWVMPPRPHARWVAHRWVHRNGGYVMVEGHWR